VLVLTNVPTNWNSLNRSFSSIRRKRLGIDIPDRKDWWSNDNIHSDLPPDDVTWWLSQKGRIGLANLVKQARRKELEWWLRIIAALTGLGGVLIGIISALKR
jgi:hypothetical protein